MSFSRQDELLQKLQRCVGKLQSKKNSMQRFPTKDIQKYKFGQFSVRQSLIKNNYPYQMPIQYSTKQVEIKNEINKHNYQNQGEEEINYQKQNYARNYLTQRKHSNQNQRGQKFNIHERKMQNGNNKILMDENGRLSINQTSRKYNNYLQSTQPQRKPLRQYDLNNKSNLAKRQVIRENNKQLNKQTIKYLKQPNKINIHQQSLERKYQSYKRPESSFKANEYKRNSISHNISYNQNINKSAQKNDLYYQKSIQFSGKCDRYQAKIKPNTGQICSTQILSKFDQGYIRSEKQQYKKPSSIEKNSQIRQRNISMGTISSVSRRNVQPNVSCTYETFKPMENKQQKQLNLKKILDEVGNANQDTFTKLQKISELNERINKRIKNIIQTFENK